MANTGPIVLVTVLSYNPGSWPLSLLGHGLLLREYVLTRFFSLTKLNNVIINILYNGSGYLLNILIINFHFYYHSNYCTDFKVFNWIFISETRGGNWGQLTSVYVKYRSDIICSLCDLKPETYLERRLVTQPNLTDLVNFLLANWL